MANHVLYDRIWESKKIKACSRDAAMAYPTIFLIADDHGRFEYNPRRIWSKAFGNREDVSLADVTSWLSEYARVGLLIRYHIDGDLAHWYGFKGRKPSERRPSAYPDPDGLPVFTEAATQGAEDRHQEGDVARTEPRQIDARDRSRTDLDQSGSDQSLAARAAPPLVPEIVRGPLWNQRACELWIRFQGPVNKAHGARITNALRPLEREHGWPSVEPLWIEALEEAAAWTDPGRFTPEVFARSFTARIRQSRGAVRAPPNPKARARDVGDMAMIQAGMKGGGRERRSLGAGDGGTADPSGARRDSGAEGDTGDDVPAGARRAVG